MTIVQTTLEWLSIENWETMMHARPHSCMGRNRETQHFLTLFMSNNIWQFNNGQTKAVRYPTKKKGGGGIPKVGGEREYGLFILIPQACKSHKRCVRIMMWSNILVWTDRKCYKIWTKIGMWTWSFVWVSFRVRRKSIGKVSPNLMVH